MTRRIRLLGALLAVAMLAVACGGDASTETTAGEPDEAPETTRSRIRRFADARRHNVPVPRKATMFRKFLPPKGALTLITITMAVMLAACGGTDSGSDEGAGSGTILTAEDVSALGEVTLTMVDYESSPGLGDAITAGIDRFKEEFPNVTIQRSSQAFADYGKTIDLAMSADDAPDIAESNIVIAKRLVPAGLVVPLDSYYEGYGWTELYPDSVQQVLQLDPTGRVSGTGSYWGQTPGGNIVGVYYNQDKLDQLGIELPSTFEEFEDALQTAKDAGELPIALGNLEQWPSNHILSTLMNQYSDPQTISDWINGKPGSTFENEGTIEALAKLQEWAQDGYISDQANGTKYGDSTTGFASEGQGVFYITGSWMSSTFDTGLGDSGGFMPLPPMTSGGQPTATGSIAAAFTISSKSENADLAAFFLDYLSGPKSTADNLAAGYLPFAGDDATTGGKVAQEVLDAWRTVNAENGLSGYLDSSTSSMGDIMFPALQSLIGGQTDPESLSTLVQGNWDEFNSGQ